jgi:CDP-glucose 4,6-dehydratase
VGPLVSDALRGVYSGRRVLVTGDTGFKGSWLAFALHELGARVQGFALPCERPEDHFERLALSDLITHRDGDLRESAPIAETMRHAEPEVVFHLAAQPLVRRAYEDPKLTFDTNVGGSVNLLEAVRRTPSVRALVYVTSDKCYRNKEWVWGYRENDELGGPDPYSASKAAAEMVFGAYQDSFFLNRPSLGAASARAGNVIGGGDWSPNRIVPDCIAALRVGRPITLRNPSSTRPWQHVLDLIYGYLLLGARLYEHPTRFAGAWNFGPSTDDVRTVRELADLVVTTWGTGTVEVARQDGAPHEAGLLQLNCDKAHQLLGWRTRLPFDRAVHESVRWYKRVEEGEPARRVTREQVARYFGGGHD